MAINACLAGIANRTNITASVCSVKGTGPKGTVTHAATAIRAIDKPQKATERARVVEFCVIASDIFADTFLKHRFL